MLPLLRAPCEEAAARAAPETPGCAAHAKPWVLAATVLASSVVFLQATIINVALPAIQETLGASVATMQWIASTYTLALAALTLVGGALGDRLGRRRMLAIGLSIVAVTSLAAGLASNSVGLIIARTLQGVGAALVAPNSLAHLSASFPRAERGRALGIWSASSSLTGGASPLLGGWLVDAASWRAVFIFCIPLAIVAALTLIRVPESRAARRAAPLDVTGATLATVVFASLTAGLIGMAGRADTAPVWMLLVGGLVLFAAFLFWEARSDAAMMPLAIFRSRSFSAANLLTLLIYFAVAGTFFLLPFMLVQSYGYSATLTGGVFLPFAIVMAALSRWSGGLIDRWGAARPLVVGPLVVAVGLTLLAWPIGDGESWVRFAVPMAVAGLGMALTVAPLTAVVMAAVSTDEAGIASGINNTIARFAALLAVAVVGLVALAVFRSELRERVAAVEAPPAVKQALLAESRDLGDARIPPEAGTAAPALAAALRGALADAFGAVALLSAALAGAAALCAAVGIDARAAAMAPTDVAAPSCEHLGQIVAAAPHAAGCEECLRTGSTWIHLRLCLVCSHVGCCDASANQHATRHFRATGHAIIQSLAAGEAWRWCYVDERVV